MLSTVAPHRQFQPQNLHCQKEKDCGETGTLCSAVGIQNRDAAVENGTVMPHIKYMITTGTISSTAGYVLKRRESRVDRCLYSFVHSGVIYIYLLLKCPSALENINQIRYTHTEVYYALKRKRILTYHNMDNPEDIMLSEIRQSKG